MSFMFNKTRADSCPRSWDEYLEAASDLCPKINGEYNYICVPNANKTNLVQFCFEGGKFPTWQIAKHCPYLHSTGILNSKNCTNFSYGCPRNHFITREVYKYPACLEINSKRGCYIADPNCISDDGEPFIPENVHSASANLEILVLAVVLGITLLLTFSLLAFFFYLRRKRNISTLYWKQGDKIRNPMIKEKRTRSESSSFMDVSTKNNDVQNTSSYTIPEKLNISGGFKDVQQQSKTKYNALHIACQRGKKGLCQYIIKHYPDMLQQVGNNGWNAALYAAEGGRVDILELLATNGVDLKHKDNSGKNILHVVCKNSKLKMCQYIIKSYPEMLKQVTNDGWNVALYAAEGGNIEILQLLAKEGVDITFKNKHDDDILQIACLNSRLKMCQYIIKNYPHMLTQFNSEGWNAALYAAKGGNVDILKLIAKMGVDLTFENKHGDNILHIACLNSKLTICQYIIKDYPQLLRKVNKEGLNAALYAVMGGNVDILELLAKEDIDLTC